MGSSAQNSSGVHWCRRRVRFNEVPEKVPEVRGFAQSQVRFNRLPEKVPEWEALVQSQVRFNRVSREDSGEGSRKPWCRAKSGSTGSGEGCREGPGEGFGNLGCRARSGSTGSTGFPALGFAARIRKICKHKTLRVLGIPPKLIFQSTSYLQDFTLVSPLFFPQSPKTVGERSKCKLIYINM